MRFLPLLCLGFFLGFASPAAALDKTPPSAPSRLEVTASKSLEWYQDKRLYVARGDAKAVRGGLTVEAGILTAHERAPAPKTQGSSPAKASPAAPKTKSSDTLGAGDIDLLTADGDVRVTTEKSRIFGDHAVYDLDQHVAYMTGGHLLYETEGETVTARDSLEYWDDRKLAVARGNAIAVKGDRKIEGDVLTAQFRDQPNGITQMHTLTANGHVTIVTKGDVARSDRAVYDVPRNFAVLSGHVRITRADGTQLNGDVAEMDFATNQSRLLNEGGNTRVRLLLTSKTTAGAAAPASASRKGRKGSSP